MVVILPYCIKAKRCEHNALGYWSGLALCLTKVRSSRARCPATALIFILFTYKFEILCFKIRIYVLKMLIKDFIHIYINGIMAGILGYFKRESRRKIVVKRSED